MEPKLAIPATARWWAPLHAAAAQQGRAFSTGFFVTQEELLHNLLKHRVMPHYLSGVGGVGDPALVDLPAQLKTMLASAPDQMRASSLCAGADSVMGGFLLNGAGVVAFLNPEDGYRSSMTHCWVDPALAFRAQFAPIAVRAQLADASQWDTPGKNSQDSPRLLDLVSKETGETLATFGTEYGDDHYPVGRFYSDALAINKATVVATVRELEARVPKADGQRSRI